jgi:serine/threonine protein kinase
MMVGSVVQDQPPTSPVVPGDIIADKYRVERVLGIGGMGVVVAARHVTLDQVVAIKFLVGDRTGSTREELVARFLAEARAAARIDSDHVCRVFDVAQTPNGIPFMVMEHLEGNDLEEELERRGQLGLTEAVDYVLQAAEAIAAAHQLGIVHRDMKPANVFLALRPDGSRRVKILDFGISKAMSVNSFRAGAEATTLGTPAYMSPEQVRASSSVDGRTDIWALGAILYEAITGQMAFVGDNLKAILDMVISDDPCPMSALRRDVPPDLEHAVSKCLERDRERRWPNAAQLARALAPFGSIGIVSSLTNVQRELGSLSSLKGVAAQSVEPMVASVRNIVATQPDPAEISQRHVIVQDWSRVRAQKRSARIFVAFVATMTCVAGVALAVHMRTRIFPPKPVAASLPPPPPAVADPPPPTADPAPPPAASSVYTASTSVQSARNPPLRAPGAKPGALPAKPASKTGPNHLLDTRD